MKNSKTMEFQRIVQTTPIVYRYKVVKSALPNIKVNQVLTLKELLLLEEDNPELHLKVFP